MSQGTDLVKYDPHAPRLNRSARKSVQPTVWVEPIWEQQPSEPMMWHERFLIYLMLGTTRTVRATLMQFYRVQRNDPNLVFGKTEPNMPNSWRINLVKWRWYDRAQAFDEAQQRKALAKHERDVQEMLRRHSDTGKVMQQAGLQSLVGKEGKITTISDVPTAIRAIATGIEIERKSAGLPSMLVELNALSDEQLQRRRLELLERIRASGRALEAEEGQAYSAEVDSE